MNRAYIQIIIFTIPLSFETLERMFKKKMEKTKPIPELNDFLKTLRSCFVIMEVAVVRMRMWKSLFILWSLQGMEIQAAEGKQVT